MAAARARVTTGRSEYFSSAEVNSHALFTETHVDGDVGAGKLVCGDAQAESIAGLHVVEQADACTFFSIGGGNAVNKHYSAKNAGALRDWKSVFHLAIHQLLPAKATLYIGTCRPV